MESLCNEIENCSLTTKTTWKFDPVRIYILLLFNKINWVIIGIFNSFNEIYINSGNILLTLPDNYQIGLIYSKLHKPILYNFKNLNDPEYSHNVLLHVIKQTTNINDNMKIIYQIHNLYEIESIEIFNYISDYNKLIKLNYDVDSLFMFEVKGTRIIIDKQKIFGHKLYKLCMLYKVNINTLITNG
jgi:hypothetical protein